MMKRRFDVLPFGLAVVGFGLAMALLGILLYGGKQPSVDARVMEHELAHQYLAMEQFEYADPPRVVFDTNLFNEGIQGWRLARKFDPSLPAVDPIMDRLIDALIEVESGGDPNAVGDRNLRNKAYGVLQIRQPYLDDVNRIAGSRVQKTWGVEKLTVEDIIDVDKARWAAEVYLTHYGRHYQKTTSNAPTAEVYARMHNGGPYGWRKESTEKYAAKVLRVMEDDR